PGLHSCIISPQAGGKVPKWHQFAFFGTFQPPIQVLVSTFSYHAGKVLGQLYSAIQIGMGRPNLLHLLRFSLFQLFRRLEKQPGSAPWRGWPHWLLARATYCPRSTLSRRQAVELAQLSEVVE